MLAVHGERVYLGSGDSYEVVVYTPDGALRRVIRKRHKALDVTPEDVKAYEKNRLEELADENWKRVTRLFAEKMDYPKTMPAYSHMLTDASGNLWVNEYRRPTEEQPSWTVFDAEGRLLGMIETPKRVALLEVGADFILGRWTDEAN
ncbi:MAG: hypothetical protein H0W30_04230 [Gemmatimonadaceae bacterium]|nr:hypothetical protein [Gemmatimonadaceae bacterium]